MIDSTEIKLRSFIREKQFFLLLFLGIVLFARPLFLGQTFFFGDLYLYFFAEKKLVASLLRSGHLPLWNPYLHGGQPLLANLNNGVLYPSNVLFVLFPLLTALNIDIVFHLLLCGAAAYLLLRGLGFQPLSAFAGAIVYGYCGYTLSLGNLYNRLLAAPYLPLQLLFWHRYWLNGNKRALLLVVLFGVIQLLAGAPETTFLSLLFLLLWAFIYPNKHRAAGRIARHWLLLLVLIGGIASIQLLPTIELVLQSPRAKINNYAAFTQFSLDPRRLPELLLSGFLGTKENPRLFWGINLEKTGAPFISSIYLGILSLVLAVFAGTNKSVNEILPGGIRKFLLATFVVSLVLSFGKFLPGYKIFYSLPIFRWFRYPIKFLTAGVLPVALLVCCTIEHYTREKSTPKFSYIWWTLAILLILFGSLFYFSGSFSTSFQRMFFETTNDAIRQGLGWSFLQVSAVAIGAAIVFRLPRTSLLVVTILAFDLFVAGWKVNPYLPRSIFSQEPPLVRTIHNEIGNGRLFRPETKHVKLFVPSEDISWGIEWDLATVNWYTANYYSIPLIYNPSFETLETSDLMDLTLAVRSLPWEKRRNLLSVGGVALILTPEQIALRSIRKITSTNNGSDTTLYLYKNEEGLPPVAFYNAGVIVHSTSQALSAMTNANFVPQKFVVLENPQARPLPCKSGTNQVKTMEIEPNLFSYSVENDCDGYVLFNIPYYKGWELRVDGKLAIPVKANGAFFAAFLSEGKHFVRLAFLPDSLILGAAISMLFLISLPFIVRSIMVPAKK